MHPDKHIDEGDIFVMLSSMPHKPHEKHIIPHHIGEGDIFNMMAEEGKHHAEEKKPIPHHLDEIDVIEKMSH
ncbi:MAG TPA: hypothetical protein PK544_10025 [Spirochaetota bacterium]|nr:hypothetical protein [Spirochaetota bacterium]HPJ37565.1 hypothetical protein [Spirochaetota bacterium]